MRVNGDVARAAEDDFEEGEIVENFDLNDDAAVALDRLRVDEGAAGLELHLWDVGPDGHDFASEKAAWHGGKNHLGLRALLDALGTVFEKRSSETCLFVRRESHHRPQR